MSLDIILTCDSCRSTVYSANITHNLGKMAKEAGLYYPLWEPESIGFQVASQLVMPLERGIEEMEENKPLFEKFNSPNHWGTYADFLPWLKELLEACKSYPQATIFVSR